MRKALCPRGEVSLRYPIAWYTSVHPRAEAAEAATASHLRRHGVLAGPRAEAKFRAIDVARHGGWPLAFAGFEALRTVTCFLTTWLFYDDAIEGVGAGAERAVAAIRGDEGLAPAEPCLQAWHAGAQAYRRRMGPRFCARLGECFRAWHDSVGEEAAQIVALRATGRHPSVAAYVACRERSIGVAPVLRLLEYACGQELAPAVLAHPALTAVERAATWAVILQNDLVSASKEEGDGQVNLLLSLQQERGLRPAAARAEIERWHDAAVPRLEAALGDLARAFPADLGVRRWLRAVRTMCHGFACWHVHAPRYVESARRCVVEYV